MRNLILFTFILFASGFIQAQTFDFSCGPVEPVTHTIQVDGGFTIDVHNETAESFTESSTVDDDALWYEDDEVAFEAWLETQGWNGGTVESARALIAEYIALNSISISVSDGSGSKTTNTSKTGNYFFNLVGLGGDGRVFRITTQGDIENAVIFFNGLQITSITHGLFSVFAPTTEDLRSFEIIALNRGSNEFVLWNINDGEISIADVHYEDLEIEIEEPIIELDDPADEIISSVTSTTTGGEVISAVNNGEPTVTLTTAGSNIEFVTQTTVQQITNSYSAVIETTVTSYSVKINGVEDTPALEAPATETVVNEITPATEQPGTAVVTIDLEFPNPDYMTPATLEELFAEANPGFIWNDDESRISHEGTDRVIYADIDPLNPQEIVFASSNVWLRNDITLTEALDLLRFDVDVLNYASTTSNGAFIGSFQNIDPYRRFIRIKYATDSDDALGALGAVIEGNLDATKVVIDGLILQLIADSNVGEPDAETIEFNDLTFVLTSSTVADGETYTNGTTTINLNRDSAGIWTATYNDGVRIIPFSASSKDAAIAGLLVEVMVEEDPNEDNSLNPG